LFVAGLFVEGLLVEGLAAGLFPGAFALASCWVAAVSIIRAKKPFFGRSPTSPGLVAFGPLSISAARSSTSSTSRLTSLVSDGSQRYMAHCWMMRATLWAT